jgi:hypothetical protein
MEVALMRSDLSPTGARYTVRRAVSLGAQDVLPRVSEAGH